MSLSSKRGYKTGILPNFRARNLSLTPAVVKGIAAVVDFLGLNHLHIGGMSHIASNRLNRLQIGGISHIVSNIIQG